NLSVVMISDKGMTKIVDSAYLGDPGKRSKNLGSLITLDQTDSLRFVLPIDWRQGKDQKLVVLTRNNSQTLNIEDIPNTTKKAKGRQLVNVGVNSYLVTAKVISK